MSYHVLRTAGSQRVTLSEYSEITAFRSHGYAGAAFICGADNYPLSIALVLERLGCSSETVARVREDIESAIVANATHPHHANAGER